MKYNSSSFDSVVVGSGLSALVYAALAAKSGERVCVLEAHEYPGGYGHTFTMGRSAKFNAQLHYVWNCGEGETVNLVLQYLGLTDKVTFEKLDPSGFDHMRVPGAELKIPASSELLIQRLIALAPDASSAIQEFIRTVDQVSRGLDLIASPFKLSGFLKGGRSILKAGRFRTATLQDVFDHFRLPPLIQALLASQWPDFLLPPEKLSFFAWVMLFTGYQRGAYYPTHHFEHVIDSLATIIKESGGELRLRHEVREFVIAQQQVTGVKVIDLDNGMLTEVNGRNVVVNMDPQQAADWIGWEHFSGRIRKKLNYEYSPSNFMIYCTVEGLDLTEHGFGRWNTFHSGDTDLNLSFRRMHEDHDYSNPSFAITTPGLMTTDASDRPHGQEIIEFLTVADFSYFEDLLRKDRRLYLKKKREIVDAIFDVMERDYIPGFRQYLKFKAAGTPTTNQRFCLSPQGNSYGSNMTPDNISLGRLSHDSSIDGLYFCNASAGYPGFTGAFWNGLSLFRKLNGN